MHIYVTGSITTMKHEQKEANLRCTTDSEEVVKSLEAQIRKVQGDTDFLKERQNAICDTIENEVRENVNKHEATYNVIRKEHANATESVKTRLDQMQKENRESLERQNERICKIERICKTTDDRKTEYGIYLLEGKNISVFYKPPIISNI